MTEDQWHKSRNRHIHTYSIFFRLVLFDKSKLEFILVITTGKNCTITSKRVISSIYIQPWSLKRATRYSQTTTKPGQNESFAEKIVSLRNMTKTMLHTIRWSSKVLRLKPDTHFFAKKIKFREKWWKGVYTLFVIDPSFRERVVESKIWWKNFFDLVKKLLTLANAFRKKIDHKTLTNMANYSLHTIRGSTVSTEAVCVLASIPSIEIVTDERRRVYSATRRVKPKSAKAL